MQARSCGRSCRACVFGGPIARIVYGLLIGWLSTRIAPPGLPDRHVGPDPDTADRRRPRHRWPTASSPPAADRGRGSPACCRGPAVWRRRTGRGGAGVGHRHGQPGPITAVLAAGQAQRRRAGRAAAALGRRRAVGAAGRRRPGRPGASRRAVEVVGGAPRRTSRCGQDLLGGADTGRDASGPARPRRRKQPRSAAPANRLPQPIPTRRAGAPALAAGRGGRGIAGVEVLGQQRTQQGRHRKRCACAGLSRCRPASGA